MDTSACSAWLASVETARFQTNASIYPKIILNQHLAESIIMKKPKTTAQPAKKEVQAEKPAKNNDLKTQPSSRKTSKKKTEKSPEVTTPKPASEATALAVTERIGLTAGTIWHYLSEHGPTTVPKLISEIDEEEKIIQRSVGWLAQENKITLTVVNRVETVDLNA